MPSALYVCLQDEDKVVLFMLDDGTGQLTRRAEVSASDGPSVRAISPDRSLPPSASIPRVGSSSLPGRHRAIWPRTGSMRKRVC